MEKPKIKTKLALKNHPDYKHMLAIASQIESDFPQIKARVSIAIVGGRFSGTSHLSIVIDRSQIVSPVEFLRPFSGLPPKEKRTKYPIFSSNNISALRAENGCYKTNHSVEEVLAVANTLEKIQLDDQQVFGEKVFSTVFDIAEPIQLDW
jgi:hypothetical protein